MPVPAGYKTLGNLQVHLELAKTVEELASNADIPPAVFWSEFSAIVQDFAPRNAALLRKRDAIQARIDAWLLERKGQEWDPVAYKQFLKFIGYLVPINEIFQAKTKNIDEAMKVAGPQLVVPIDNARYALNAANARWGSLLDAFYGTTAGPPETDGAEKGSSYNPVRGQRVFEYAHKFLDETVPLVTGTYQDVVRYSLSADALSLDLSNGQTTGLQNPEKFVGYRLDAKGRLESVLLHNNGLHIEISITGRGPGKTHPAGVNDIILESALTSIMDCEDSVATVDAVDKSLVYRNWAKLMDGTLQISFSRKGKTVTRKLNQDKTFHKVGGGTLILPGRALMLVRNVGIHIYTDACLTKSGQQIPESILDAMVLVLGSIPDIRKQNKLRNSEKGSMYVVRPKLHGPAEVAFVVELFTRVEQALRLPPNTVKLGIMDEERRTTVNLYECIRQAQERVIFINTGFLDRTGDEIHTSFEAGPVLPKANIKSAIWRMAYEDWNVDMGIAAGLLGKAQIGKGMWAKPDELGEMLATKGSDPKSGATTAWVPSPTAGTLHAIHYHQVNVNAVQQELSKHGPRASVDDILTPPLLDRQLSPAEIRRELENNSQGILGYVVRWIEHGVGCSKVPDINDVGLMEDRATLRIASQHIANWIHHGITSEQEVIEVMKKMAELVDRQNAGDRQYRPMSPGFNNNAWKAAMELVFGGKQCPNGYTEFALIKWRRMEKRLLSPSANL